MANKQPMPHHQELTNWEEQFKPPSLKAKNREAFVIGGGEC